MSSRYVPGFDSAWNRAKREAEWNATKERLTVSAVTLIVAFLIVMITIFPLVCGFWWILPQIIVVICMGLFWNVFRALTALILGKTEEQIKERERLCRDQLFNKYYPEERVKAEVADEARRRRTQQLRNNARRNGWL